MERDEIQEQLKIEPFTLLYDILMNWWVILLGAIAAALLTYVVLNVRYVPRYSTSATFVVASKENSNAVNNLSSANTMAQTFQNILKSNAMKKIVMEKLKLNLDDAEIEAEVLGGTNILVLKVTESSPKAATDLIHTLMEHYSEISFYMVGNSVMDVLEEPRVPVAPDNPLNAGRDMKRGAVAGALVLLFLFGMMSYMKDSIKSEDDIEVKLDAGNLGGIPFERKRLTWDEVKKKTKKALLVNDPLSGFAFVEAYKKLATRVDYRMAKEDRKVLVVTSVSENEGKSTVAANLAITLAEQSKRVLLIEGDLRRPSQFLIFGEKPEDTQELGEFLKGNGKISDILIRSKIRHLYLLIGKNGYASSTELVHSVRMRKLIEACKKTMDYIIIDSPPAGMMGDAEALAEYADAVLLVVRQNFILSEDINDVLDAFREHHSKVLGCVLNGVRTFATVPGVENYYGRYGKYGNYARNRSE